MKRKILPIALVSLLLGFLFDFFFFDKILGISIFLYSLLMLGATVYLADLFKARLNLSAYLLMPVILFFAFMVFARASGMLAFFNIIVIIYLLLLIVKLSVRPGHNLTKYTIWQYFDHMPGLPFRFLREASIELRGLMSRKENRPERASYEPVLRGIALALPILLLFVLLLSSADLVFQKYVTSIFDFHINSELAWRVVLSLLVASAFIGAYALLFMRPAEVVDEGQSARKFDLGKIEASIVLGSVELLFFVFLLVQATYLFGGNHHVLTTNFTYAEYARHGFFELITVAAISLLLIWIIKQSTRLHSAAQEKAFKWLNVVLLAEVMIIMVSAHSRLSLYEQTYGFTRSRLISHFFIYWLGLALALIAIYIIRSEKEHQFAFRLFASVLMFFAVLNLVNPDALIARHNINRLNATGKLDAYSLTYLSEDATPVIATLLTSKAQSAGSSQKVRDIVARHLYQQKLAIDCRSTDWQSANLARMNAGKLLASKSEQLKSGRGELQTTCLNGQLR
jgi:hypothetical protein